MPVNTRWNLSKYIFYQTMEVLHWIEMKRNNYKIVKQTAHRTLYLFSVTRSCVEGWSTSSVDVWCCSKGDDWNACFPLSPSRPRWKIPEKKVLSRVKFFSHSKRKGQISMTFRRGREVSEFKSLVTPNICVYIRSKLMFECCRPDTTGRVTLDPRLIGSSPI